MPAAASLYLGSRALVGALAPRAGGTCGPTRARRGPGVEAAQCTLHVGPGAGGRAGVTFSLPVGVGTHASRWAG